MAASGQIRLAVVTAGAEWHPGPARGDWIISLQTGLSCLADRRTTVSRYANLSRDCPSDTDFGCLIGHATGTACCQASLGRCYSAMTVVARCTVHKFVHKYGQ
jgi:hypothetical protein